MTQQIGNQWWQVAVDRHDKTPPYLQIAATIRHKIATGELAPGSPLPSVRQLMSIAGVTSTTVTRSYHLLQEEGLINIRPGVGAVVAEAKQLSTRRRLEIPSALVEEIDELITRLLQQGVDSALLERTLRTRLHKATSSRYVVFTTAEATVSEHYANTINKELADLGIRCVPVPLAALLRPSEDTKRLIKRAEHVFTVLSIYNEVTERINTIADTPVTHLLTQITLETHERLRAISPNDQVALVVQRRYRTSAHGLLLSYVPQDNLRIVRSTTKAQIVDALSTADVVVHTVGTRLYVANNRSAAPNAVVIELEYAIRSDVMKTIRDLLSASSF